MKSKISTLNLIKMAFYAIAHPNKAFKEIPDASPDYTSLIAILALTGFLLSITDNFLMEQKFVLLTDPFHYITITVYSIFLWIFGSFSFSMVAKFFKKKVSIKKIEIGVFYIWLVWALVPPFFLPHILFHLKEPLIFGTPAHVGWLWFFIMIPLLSFFMIRDLIGLPFKKSLILAVAIPFFGRYFLEGTLVSTHLYFQSKGIAISLWQVGTFLTTLLFPPVFLTWLALKRQGLIWQYFTVSVLISAILSLIVASFIF